MVVSVVEMMVSEVEIEIVVLGVMVVVTDVGSVGAVVERVVTQRRLWLWWCLG